MKTIFEAANTLEAHMVSDLLQQQGIQANIEGEMLQGGAGELQAQGFVRVTVDDADFEKALQIVKDWDVKQPADTPSVIVKKKGANGTIGFVLGLLVGAGVMLLFC